MDEKEAIKIIASLFDNFNISVNINLRQNPKRQVVPAFRRNSTAMDWYKENYELGIELGYPKCCVHEFCKDNPDALEILSPKELEIDQIRLKAANIDGEYTGFIPCAYHANEIVNGRTKLTDLITDRNPILPEFPKYGKFGNS